MACGGCFCCGARPSRCNYATVRRKSVAASNQFLTVSACASKLRPVKVSAMPVQVDSSRSYPVQVVVTSARRQRFLRGVATAVTALAAFIAILIVSIISLALGLT